MIFNDDEIGRLIKMPKMGADANAKWPTLRSKRGHVEAHATFGGTDQNEFRVVLRRSTFNPLAFSAVLMVRVPDSTRWFRLRRYNGNNHEHFNLVEGNRFRAFHIHTATERYQRRGGREDGYAEPTERFSSYDEAVRCLAEDAKLEMRPSYDPIQRGVSSGAEV
ncbi:MAG: hypothetical protein OXN89_25240 [Bryobacterales bacterium]|nr:hypothetical protein [Bryobacterales bacterium]